VTAFTVCPFCCISFIFVYRLVLVIIFYCVYSNKQFSTLAIAVHGVKAFCLLQNFKSPSDEEKGMEKQEKEGPDV
jgi:hypothetical protein